MNPAPSPSAPRRGATWALVVVGLLAGALLWRLPITPPEWRYTLCENDSLYQLHRVQECLRHYPHVPSIDRYSHVPSGHRAPWLALHPLFYATIAQLAGLAADHREALVAVLGWGPPLFGLLAVVLAMAIGRCFTENRWCIATIGFLCAFSSDVCRPFFFGTIDHHLFAHVGTLLCVWGRLRERRAGWLVGLIALIAMTPEAILYASLLLACLFAAELAAVAGGHRQRPSRAFWFLSPALVGLAALLAQRCVETAPLPLTDLSWTYLTLFQPLWLAALGGSALGAVVGSDRVLRGRCDIGHVVLAISAALAVVAVTCGTVLYLSGALTAVLGRLLASHRIFVGEEASVFHAGFWATPAWYRVLAFSGVFVIARLAGAARTRAPADEWFRWIVLAGALAFGFKEFRHLYVLSSLQLVGLAVAAFDTVAVLHSLALFRGQVTRWLPVGAMTLALAPIFYTANLADRTAIHGAACDRLPVLTEMTDWLRTGTPDPTASGDAAPTYGVFAPWSIGHHVRVLADRPVIVDPLNYEVTADTEQTLERVWLSGTAGELADALRAEHARYLVLTNPAEEIVGTLRRRGIRPDQFATLDATGALVFRPAMNQFAGFRLFMRAGWSTEFGQLQPRFVSTEAEVYTVGGDAGGTRQIRIPKGQIYELKPGARLTAMPPSAAGPVTVSYVLRLRGGPPTEVRIPLTANGDGGFEFHTALPAPVDEDSFRVESGYRFTAGTQQAEVVVTQAMVDTHAMVPIQWSAATMP